MPRSTNEVKTHAVYIALCAHEPARCCRNSGRIRRKMSEGRWRTDAAAAQPCDLSKLPPAGHPRTPKNMMKVVRPGQRMRRQRAIGCGQGGRPQPLSDAWMPEPLHECPRSPPNPSPSQYLGARNDEQKSLCASSGRCSGGRRSILRKEHEHGVRRGRMRGPVCVVAAMMLLPCLH